VNFISPKEEYMKSHGNHLLFGVLAAMLLAVWAMPASADTLRIMNPVGEPRADLKPFAKRLDTLEGKRIGLYVARRANAFEILERVEENLKKMYPTATIMGGKEGTIWAKKSYDRAGDIESLIKEKPDAIIMAISS
jgi:hypothetical protein